MKILDVLRARVPRAQTLIGLVASIFLVSTWSHVFFQVSAGHTNALNAAQNDLANITRLTQEHVSRTLRSADQAMRFVQSRYLEVGKRLDLQDLITRGVVDNEIFNQIGIIDAQGIYVLGNIPVTGTLDLSDREHFKVHVKADTGKLFVSKLVLGRASGKLSIQLTRRINRPNGEFAGVVVISIDHGYFSRFYNELKLGQEGFSALYGLDGVVRARQFDLAEDSDADTMSAAVLARIAQGELSGVETERSNADAVQRMTYFRKVPHYQLVVLAGLDRRDFMAAHERARDALVLQASLLSAMVLLSALALMRYLQATHREKVARAQTIAQVQDKNEQLNAIFTLSPDGFVSFDRHRRISYVSPTFATMTAMGSTVLEGLGEYDFSDWLTRRCDTLAPFAGVAAMRAMTNARKPNTRELIEISGGRKLLLQVGILCSESRTVSQILCFRDVTHERAAEQLKSEFLSTAAHELRTPMASIFGFSELLATQETDTGTKREFLDIIYRQSKLMCDILDELLDLARIESRRDKDFRYIRVCLQELMADILKAFTLPAGRAPAELLVPQETLYVIADEGKLRQAILNVLSNAYKYSSVGETVMIRIEKSADMGATERACIHIDDQGIGMTGQQLARVCERFYRADTSGKVPGTGLGMSIAKEIIDLHHGELKVSSTPGEGTRVSMIFPCRTR
jgi:signal transduction histidine kinase